MTRARSRCFPVLALLLVAAGCEQQAPAVYVLESPLSVTLTASASPASVERGESVVLHVQRRTVGSWKKVPRDQVKPGQCWVYRPPPEFEEEVASDVQWEVVPENSVWFNPEYRFDHTRQATPLIKGVIRLTPFSKVACEPDRLVEGPAIEIEVS